MLSRKEALISSTLLALGLAGCSPRAPAVKSIPPTPIRSEPTPDKKTGLTYKEAIPAPTKEEIRGIINSLPDSIYKEFIVAYAMPFLDDQPPKVVNLGKGSINVHNVSVGLKKSPRLGGSMNMREVDKTPRIFLQNDVYYAAYFPFLLPDAIFKFQTVYPKGTVVGDGIEPKISLALPNEDQFISREYLEVARRIRPAVLLKESFTLAFEIAYLQSMMDTTLSLKAPVVMSDGLSTIDAISQGFVTGIANIKRLNAVCDIAPFVMALKALNGTTILITPQQSTLIRSADLGSEVEKLIITTSQFVLNNQQVLANLTGVNHSFDLPK